MEDNLSSIPKQSWITLELGILVFFRTEDKGTFSNSVELLVLLIFALQFDLFLWLLMILSYLSYASSFPFFLFLLCYCCFPDSSFTIPRRTGLLRLRLDLDLSSLSLGSIFLANLLLLFQLFFYKDFPVDTFFLLGDFSRVFDFFLIQLLQVWGIIFLALVWVLRRQGTDILLCIFNLLGFFSLLSSSWMILMQVNSFQKSREDSKRFILLF